MKTILIMKVRYDLGMMNETQVDLVKAAIMAGYDDETRKKIVFEVETEEEPHQTHHLIQQVRAEFRKQDRRR